MQRRANTGATYPTTALLAAPVSSDPTSFATDHLRTHDFDWYATLLFAPAGKRTPLIALFAFLTEIARVRSLISDPMAGEIRLQWWRDALAGQGHGDVTSNPLAAALQQAITEHALPVAPLLATLDARTFDLYDDPMPSTADLEGYAGETLSGPLALAASILSGQSPAQFADVAGHGGVALTIARLLQDFPFWASRGQCYLPTDLMEGLDPNSLNSRNVSPELTKALRALAALGREHLAKAQAVKSEAHQSTAALWLPFSLAQKTFQQADAWAQNPFAKPLTAPRWQRLYRLWRASKR